LYHLNWEDGEGDEEENQRREEKKKRKAKKNKGSERGSRPKTVFMHGDTRVHSTMELMAYNLVQYMDSGGSLECGRLCSGFHKSNEYFVSEYLVKREEQMLKKGREKAKAKGRGRSRGRGTMRGAPVYQTRQL
jgi:hypothetical protein